MGGGEMIGDRKQPTEEIERTREDGCFGTHKNLLFFKRPPCTLLGTSRAEA
jgi:hypothetical protein